MFLRKYNTSEFKEKQKGSTEFLQKLTVVRQWMPVVQFLILITYFYAEPFEFNSTEHDSSVTGWLSWCIINVEPVRQ